MLDFSNDLICNDFLFSFDQLYRIEDYEQSYASYIELIKNSGDDYEDERYVNLTAVLAGLSLEKAGDVDDADFLDLSENTYEIVYNKACILIGKGQYEAAVKKLEQAEGEFTVQQRIPTKTTTFFSF